MKLEYWSAWSAFASLQATAKDFAGLNNARLLIQEAKKIRSLRHEQIVEEVEREHAILEVRHEASPIQIAPLDRAA